VRFKSTAAAKARRCAAPAQAASKPSGTGSSAAEHAVADARRAIEEKSEIAAGTLALFPDKGFSASLAENW